jgi:DNA polymerase I-like protein with 3'-5' exonuclease and polymerase domains
MLSPFRSKTGRSQPSNQKFIYGPAKWVRHLIKPEEGNAVAYVDYSQQEWAIAGKLSNCQAMMDCYLADDPYIEFARMAKAVPKNATKASHPVQRQQFKVCALGVLFGLTGEGMARKLGIPSEGGRQLLRLHKNVFPEFWKWQEQIIANALLSMEMQTVMGWKMYVPPRTNLRDRNKERTLANFPMQANGADMLRIAVINASEMGVRLLAPIHDALLIESTVEGIDYAVKRTQEAMADASVTVLDGFRLSTDVEIVRWPDRYTDERGSEMWSKIMKLLPKA